LDIKPLKRLDSKVPDLVVVSSNADYTEYAVQILENDGKGNFFDKTAERLPTPIRGTGGWIKRIHIADLENGSQLLATRTDGLESPPRAQLFLSDDGERFVLQKTITDGNICGVTSINGQMSLIVSDGLRIRLEPALQKSASSDGPTRENVLPPHQPQKFKDFRYE